MEGKIKRNLTMMAARSEGPSP